MKEQSLFIAFIGDSPTVRVFDYLLTVRGLDFCISDLADNAHIGRATLYRIWKNLIDKDILIATRTIGKAKLYKLNTSDPKVKKLIEIDDMLILEALRSKVRAKKSLRVVS
ncbi:MAG: hypothetical protein Q8R18_02545 [bacterium]|nr:hypothetical protein [bacterium]